MSAIAPLRTKTRASLCVDCGKCTPSCPLAPHSHVSPRHITSIYQQRQADQQATELEQCLTCGACEERCPQGVKFTEFVQGVRSQLPTESRSACPHGEVFQAGARSMAKAPEVQRDMSWLEDDLEVASEGEVALFVGCLPSFDALFKGDLGIETVEIARSAIRVLNRVGIKPVIVAQERCCGHDLLWKGDNETFQALAEANTAAFRERGVKTIVAVCAECTRTWKLDYAQAVPSYKPKVQHLSELLAEKVEAGELEFKGDGATSVTFHDPCRLGRHLGVYDAPRTVLGAVPDAELREMHHSKRDAMCCGTSGFQNCDAASRQVQESRLAEATASGAEKLVTACPKCFIHLNCAQTGARRRNDPTAPVEIVDFSVFAAQNLGKPNPKSDEGVPVAQAEMGEAQ